MKQLLNLKRITEKAAAMIRADKIQQTAIRSVRLANIQKAKDLTKPQT